jgi:hypothetical protein
MSAFLNDIEQLEEEAVVARKWAVEKADWLENMSVQKRYEGDPMSIERRRHETAVMDRLATRLDTRVAAMKARGAH